MTTQIGTLVATFAAVLTITSGWLPTPCLAWAKPVDASRDQGAEQLAAEGAALSQQGRFDEAESLARHALAIVERALGPDHPSTRRYLETLGSILEAKGDHAGAVGILRRGCQEPAPGGARIEGGQESSQTGQVARLQAESCSSELASALWGWASQGGGSAANDQPEALMAEAFGQAQRATVSAAGVELARSSALIAARREGVGDLAARYEADLLRRDSLDAELVKAVHGERLARAGGTAALAESRKAIDDEIARLTEQLKARSPCYWDYRSPEPLSLGDLIYRSPPPSVYWSGPSLFRKDQALLQYDEAAVLWMIPPGANKGLVFAVSREGLAWARIGLSGAEIQARVDHLRRQINPDAYARGPAAELPPLLVPLDPNWGGFDRETAYELYQALLGDPKIQAVIGPKHTLMIAPSGPMWSLPPGLLVTEKPPEGWVNNADPATLRATRWLLRDKAVALLPAISSLRTLRRLLVNDRPAAPERNDKLLAFADPDFGGRTSPGVRATAAPRGGAALNGALALPRLPGTRIEALALAAALGAPMTSVLTDASASKSQLVARNADGRLEKVKVLEFATHGLVSGDAGVAEPALALAKGDKPADELLLASEVTGLKINADWTLLSACNTASPDESKANGLSGLSRAFFFAGAVSVLVSHWPVDDKVTSKLIPDILKRQETMPGLGRAEALRLASLAILDNHDPDDPTSDHALPSFWAPFTLVREPGPLDGHANYEN